MTNKIVHKPSALMRVFLICAMWNYSYYYFFEFNQGISLAPSFFFVIKYLFGMIVIFHLVFKSKHIPVDIRLACFCFLGLIVVIHFLHWPQYENAHHFNDLVNLVFFSPLFLFAKEIDAVWFFKVLPNHLAIQVLVSVLLLFGYNVHLWEERSIIGAFGNANSFGLALNIAIFYLLSMSRDWSIRHYMLVGVLGLGVLLTRSASQLGVLVIGCSLFSVFYFYRQLGKISILISAGVIGILVAWRMEWLDQNLLLAGANFAGNFFGAIGVDIGVHAQPEFQSRSVELREEIHVFALRFLMDANFYEILLGGFVNTNFLLFDSQFLMYLVNYGFFGFFGFILLLFWLFRNAFVNAMVTRDWFVFLAFTAFLLTFIFSRVLYYFPLNVIFFLLVVLSSTRLLRNGASRFGEV